MFYISEDLVLKNARGAFMEGDRLIFRGKVESLIKNGAMFLPKNLDAYFGELGIVGLNENVNELKKIKNLLRKRNYADAFTIAYALLNLSVIDEERIIRASKICETLYPKESPRIDGDVLKSLSLNLSVKDFLFYRTLCSNIATRLNKAWKETPNSKSWDVGFVDLVICHSVRNGKQV